jgi:hypothetical protein
MHVHRDRVAFVSLLALSVAGPHIARAQSLGDTATVVAPTSRPIAAWASVGLGSGAVHGTAGGLLAGMVRAHVSVGSLLLTYRGSDVGPFIAAGDGVSDDAVLAGVRTRGRRLFASTALGYARASHYHQCDGCGVTTVDPGVGVLAYELAMHANLVVPGIAVSFSGNIGPSRVRYSAFTVALELGWFGR